MAALRHDDFGTGGQIGSQHNRSEHGSHRPVRGLAEMPLKVCLTGAAPLASTSSQAWHSGRAGNLPTLDWRCSAGCRPNSANVSITSRSPPGATHSLYSRICGAARADNRGDGSNLTSDRGRRHRNRQPNAIPRHFLGWATLLPSLAYLAAACRADRGLAEFQHLPGPGILYRVKTLSGPTVFQAASRPLVSGLGLRTSIIE